MWFKKLIKYLLYFEKKKTKAPSKALQTMAGGNLNGKSSLVKIFGFIMRGGKSNSGNSLWR